MTSVQEILNQIIVLGLAAVGALYIYRGLEKRIVAVEGRVSTLESLFSRIAK